MKNQEKSKQKRSDTTKNQSYVTDLLDLNKYCPRKTFFTIFLTESQFSDRKLLETLVDTGGKYEDLSCITFISLQDVENFYKNADEVKLPPVVSNVLKEVCKDISHRLEEDMKMTARDIALLSKLKLIHTMYHQYTSEVKKQRSRSGLDEDLGLLIKECRKSKAPTGKKDKATDTNKSASQVSKKRDKDNKDKAKGKKEADNALEEDIDYTTTTIENVDNIVFEDNIYNCIWFYVFTGFYDTSIFQYLTEFGFPISAIMALQGPEKIRTSRNGPSIKLENDLCCFWKVIDSLFYYDRQEFSENTILMKFKVDESVDDDNALDVFENLLYAIRNVVDMKLNHVNYLRHLFIHKRLQEYKRVPLFCMKKYFDYLKQIPFECRDTLFVLKSLLGEVCARTDLDQSKSEIGSASITVLETESYSNTCVNVFDFAFQKRKSESLIKPIAKSVKTFFCGENDELTIKLHSYGKKLGRQMYDTSVAMLKTSNRIINLLDIFENDYSEVSHTHDRDPTSETIPVDESFMHFLYLFLFSTFKKRTFVPLDNCQGDDFTEYLIAYNQEQIWNSFKVKTPEKEKYFFGDNYYDVAVTDFIFKEMLSPNVLVQELFAAEDEFVHCDAKFSPETNNLLVQFHDNLDEFGINTKIYEVPLRTPVCVRDYCKYIVVEEKNWIMKNSPPKYVRHVEMSETCSGLGHIMEQPNKMFEEYYYLLDIKENSEQSQDEEEEVAELPKSEVHVSFDEIVTELENFPTSKNLYNYCEKIADKSHLAYDFGPKYFQLTGSTTTFHSHDGVKVVVDNARFLGAPEKCTVNISYKKTSLIMHSSKDVLYDDYTFHVNLEDGTLILFVLQNDNPKKKLPKDIKVESSIPEFKGSSSEQSKDEGAKDIKNGNYNFQVSCIERTVFEKMLQDNNKKEHANAEDDEGTITDVAEYDSEYNLLQTLKNAVEDGKPIYKVTNDCQYLQKLQKEVNVPLYSIVKRVLSKGVRQRKIGAYVKKYGEDFQGMFKRKFYNSGDFRITLPNGLYVTTYPSVSNEPCVEIKQEFLSSESQNAMTHEEFRLFSREGFVLIKKIDATITILKSSGDIIELEKPMDTETTSLKPCHCLDINDYIKRLNKIQGRQDGGYAFSRRINVNSKKSRITDENVLEILNGFDVPYRKKNILKFNGSKVSIQGSRISMKTKFSTTEEKDFLAEQMFFDRNDGFKCIVDRNGKWKVKFADGTQITSIMDVSGDLCDGYVYVSLYFIYEHPNYAAVTYGPKNSFTVGLNNDVTLNGNQDSVTLMVNDDLCITTTKEAVAYKKSCFDCPGIFFCKLNVKSFTENRWQPNETFFQVNDSYKKEFSSDFVGNCKRNVNYIKKSKNSFGCNHSSKMTYKKIFVVNKNYTGEMFWTEGMVEAKRYEFGSNRLGTVKSYTFPKNKNVSVVDFRRNSHYSYCNRFLNNELLYTHFCLRQYEKAEEKPVFYSTFRQLFQMLDVDYIRQMMVGIQGVLQNECCGCVDEINENLFKNVSNIIQATEEKEDSEIVEEEEVPEPPTCKCVKTKVDIKTKISKWRNEKDKYLNLIKTKDIPVYFKSPFCSVDVE